MTRQQKLAEQKMVPLIISMAVPAMISMLISALYNIVDSIYVSRISEAALTAVSVVFPYQQLIIAVAVGTGVGVNSLIARNLGAHQIDQASRAARHGLMLSLLGGAVFIVLGITSPAILQHFTNTPEVLEMAVQYAQIVITFSMFTQYSIMCEKIIQATGNMVIPMIQVGMGAIINIILDPILIFGMFGLPAMGVRGAALATIIAQICTCIMGVIMVHFHQKDLNTDLRNFKLSLPTVRGIYQIGFPSMCMTAAASVMTGCLNLILIQFSETGVAVLAVFFKLQSFIMMPVYGVNQGAIPVMGYSYGAGNQKRLFEAFRVSNIIATILVIAGFASFQLIPETMMSWFTDASMWENGTPELVTYGVPALRTISWSFLGAGTCIVCSALFQATGHGMAALITSISRQILSILPIAWLFSLFWGMDGVWFGFPCAEIVSVTASWGFVCYLMRTDYRLLQPRTDKEKAAS